MAKKPKSASKPSRPASKSKKGKPAAPKAIWSVRNVKTLVKFLVKHKAAAGDGASFKMSTFKEAAAHLAKKEYEGAEKTGDACKNKWGRVRAFSFIFVGAMPLTSCGILPLAEEGVLGRSEAEESIRLLIQ